MNQPERVAYPDALEAAEAALIDERRRHVPPVDGQSPFRTPQPAGRLPDDAIGFGLSGGGIRSATFCLGLFQALAEVKLVRRIDFISTVSGGGYFGSFLGRLFTRDWIAGPQDAERILIGQDPAPSEPGPVPPAGIGARVFRWLRENGRYLAPRGSGDVLLLGAIAARNWVAVQVVLITFVLGVFVLLQLLRGGVAAALDAMGTSTAVTEFLVCTMPGGTTLLWWSPWLVTVLPLVTFWVLPTGWAYFLVSHEKSRIPGLHPIVGPILLAVFGAAGFVYYLGLDYVSGSTPAPHALRLIFCGAAIGFSLLALAWRWAATAVGRRRDPASPRGTARNVLSRWLASGLSLMAFLLAVTLVDSVAVTAYAVWTDDQSAVVHWIGAVFAGFAAVGAFARPIAQLVGAKSEGRPGISFSILSWVAAAVVVVVWLVSIGMGAYAIVWRMQPIEGKPQGLGAPPAALVLGSDSLVVTPENGGFVVRSRARQLPECAVPAAPTQQPNWVYVGIVFLALAVMSLLFGHTTSFANMSSLHAFYAARLTRAFLGASNRGRLVSSIPVTETVVDDDIGADAYFRWPGSRRPGRDYPWLRGGPLHLLNVTLNETLDVSTGVQRQDRNGTGLALGPTGISLGIRHHLVRRDEPSVAYPRLPVEAGDPTGTATTQRPRVFDDRSEPESLPLGRWVSISGAAFTAAAGAQTTVPVALLAGMFNVRLGYWWDSGTEGTKKARFAEWFPVQYALFAESLARTRGTADRLWSLSDGGHFENMGGYELIRRRLPVIVIIDGEADPDYTFQGLSDLVRKARLDFNAEVTFLNTEELCRVPQALDDQFAPTLPDEVRQYFGNLDTLRRGRWSDENLPPIAGKEGKRFTIEIDRTRVSRAHAALARIEYLENGDLSWLVYVKASLTGDEPQDVCHYHRAHPEFPHEATTDQFFDEAQWESYRRLGLHVGHRVLRPELFDHLRDHPPQRPADRR